MGREFPKLVTLVNLLGDNFVYLSSVYKCITDPFLSREKFYMTHWRRSQGREYMQVLRLTLRWVEVPGVVTVYLISRVWLFAKPQGPQHARLSCLACSDSCPLSRWCHPSISSSVIPFSSRLQSFPASGSFPMSWFFTSGGQSIGASALASILPMNIRGWFPSGWTGLIILIACRKRFLKQHEGWKWQG